MYFDLVKLAQTPTEAKFIRAAYNDDSASLADILSAGVSDKIRGIALRAAAEMNATSVVAVLVGSGNFSDLDRYFTLETAAKEGYAGLFFSLMTQYGPSLSEHDRGYLIKDGVKSWNSEILEGILNSGRIPQQDLVNGRNFALEEGWMQGAALLQSRLQAES